MSNSATVNLSGTEVAEVLEASKSPLIKKTLSLPIKNMIGYMYILECSDGSYYTGSTIDIELRIEQHQKGEGANHTKKRLPVKLVYFEIFHRIDEAFNREKQVQGWRREKKEALINNFQEKLPELAFAYRDIAKRWL